MKSSNKLVAAGIGLVVVATMGFLPALASDGETDLAGQDPATESIIPTVAAETQQPEQTKPEAAETSEQAPEGGLLGEAVSEEGVVTEVEDASGNQPQLNGATSEKPAATKVAREESSVEVTPKEEPAQAEAVAEQPAQQPAQQEAAPEPAGVTEVNSHTVAYTTAVSYRAVATVKATVVESDLQATVSAAQVEQGTLAPLLSATSDAPQTPGQVVDGVGEATANGQSMVVWFELPPAEGPVLEPGSATQPLLGEAVSESAASTSAVISAEAAKSVPSEVVSAAAPQAVQNTAIERGLARTGSVAQYAALLSAVAMVIGIGMLVGAAAARRKYVTR